tara:strand:+ start:227 stop:1174 length:948 start_codon:yes stop_codon:yes gene_type:complete
MEVKKAEHFSASSISAYERCQKLYDYEYNQRYRPINISTSLKTGLMMHDAQEMYLRGFNQLAVLDSITQEVRDNAWDKDPLLLPKLRSYIKGYYNRWEREDKEAFGTKRYEVMEIEEDFRFNALGPGTDSPAFVGRVDGVLRDVIDDSILLMEHKNVSSKDWQDPTSISWQSLPMNNQVTIYAEYLKRKYDLPVYLWYDVVITSPNTKPKIVDRKTKARESIEAFEERLTDSYLENGVDNYIRRKIPVLENSHKYRMMEIVEIAEEASRMIHPKRNTQACKSFGGCPFFQSCLGTEKVEESSKFQIVESLYKEQG